MEFKGAELRLKRRVLASAPTCLRWKWLHSSVWHTNSIMHSWAVRASLLLLPEATCLPCHRTHSHNKIWLPPASLGADHPCCAAQSLTLCFYSLQMIFFNVKKNFWYVVELCVRIAKAADIEVPHWKLYEQIRNSKPQGHIDISPNVTMKPFTKSTNMWTRWGESLP